MGIDPYKIPFNKYVGPDAHIGPTFLQIKQTARSSLPFCVLLINLILPNLPGNGAHQVQLGPLLIIRQLVADLARGKATLGA